MKTFSTIYAVLLLVLGWSVTLSAQTLNVMTDFNGSTDDIQPAFSRALDDARDLLDNGSAQVVLKLPEGVYFASEAIKILGFDYGGELIIEGASREKTTIVSRFGGNLSNYRTRENDGIIINDSLKVTIRNLHITRNQLSTTQGFVTSTNGAEVTLQILDGFPSPVDLDRWNFRDAGRYLMRYTYEDKSAPRIDPSAFKQIAWTSVEALGENQFKFICKQNAEYQVGDLLAVKSKGDGQLIRVLGDSANILLENLRLTHASRTSIEIWPDAEFAGSQGYTIRNVIINRPDYLVNGWAPCIGPASDGMRINGDNVLIEHCTVEATGDDGIALDGGNNQTVRYNYVKSGFSRGIVAHGAHGVNGSIDIYENRIENIKQEAVSIEQIVPEYAASFTGTPRPFSIQRNQISDTGPFPTIKVGIDCDLADINVSDNWIESHYQNATTVEIGTAANSLIIANNVIASWSAVPASGSTSFVTIANPEYISKLSGSGSNTFLTPIPNPHTTPVAFNSQFVTSSIQFSGTGSVGSAPSLNAGALADTGLGYGGMPKSPSFVTQSGEVEYEPLVIIDPYIQGFESGVIDESLNLTDRNLVNPPSISTLAAHSGQYGLAFEVNPDSTGRILFTPGDLSSVDGIRFWIRSASPRNSELLVRIQTDTGRFLVPGAVTTTWTPITILWSDLQSGDFPNFDGNWPAIGVKFYVQVEEDTLTEPDWIYIDDISMAVAAPPSGQLNANLNSLRFQPYGTHLSTNRVRFDFSSDLINWAKIEELPIADAATTEVPITNKIPGFFRAVIE